MAYELGKHLAEAVQQFGDNLVALIDRAAGAFTTLAGAAGTMLAGRDSSEETSLSPAGVLPSPVQGVAPDLLTAAREAFKGLSPQMQEIVQAMRDQAAPLAVIGINEAMSLGNTEKSVEIAAAPRPEISDGRSLT